jgi:glycosyltransferase involved in cell wall biosynthesis
VTRPVVSVRLITYNHAPYIAQAIDSILSQRTSHPYEVIIGEDCSTDGTREIALEYQARYPDLVRVVTSDRNVGARANSLRANAACRGKYLAFCDGDDYWHSSTKLQKQVDLLEAYPDVGLVHSEADILDEVTGLITHSAQRAAGLRYNDDPDPFAGLLSETYRIYTATVCVRKQLLDQVIAANPYELARPTFLMGDTPRWLELSRVTRFAYIDESLATYRQLPESASRSEDRARTIAFFESGLAMRQHYLEKYGATPELRETCIRTRYATLLLQALSRRDPVLARYVMKSMRSEGVPIRLRQLAWFAASHSGLAQRLWLKASSMRRQARSKTQANTQ